MRLVLAYDVVSDRRRTRLFEKLHAYLEPVQKSVFEGNLPTRRLPDLLRMVRREIDHETDTVRVYHLCRGCRALTDHIGTAHVVEGEADDVVI